MVNDLMKVPQWGQTELEICRFINKPLQFLEKNNPMPKLIVTPKRFREYNLLVAEHRHIYNLIKELSGYSYTLSFDKYLIPHQYELFSDKGKSLGCIEIIKVGNAYLQFLQANRESFDNIIKDSMKLVAVSFPHIILEEDYKRKILVRFRYRPRGFAQKIRYTRTIKLPPTFDEIWDLKYGEKLDTGNPKIEADIKLLPRYVPMDKRRIKIWFYEAHPTNQDYLAQFIDLLTELYTTQKSEVDLDGYITTWAKRILHDFEQGNVRL